jgi:hypothetical protein
MNFSVAIDDCSRTWIRNDFVLSLFLLHFIPNKLYK